MTATTMHGDAAVTATVPYALQALADHITTHQLAVETIDIGAQVSVWILAGQSQRWLDTEIDIDAIVHAPGHAGAWRRHVAHGVLHGSCVKVRLCWITQVDHGACRGDDAEDCDQVICYCEDVTAPCEGTVEPGCDHPGEFVCDRHRSSCDDCRIDSASDVATVRWFR